MFYSIGVCLPTNCITIWKNIYFDKIFMSYIYRYNEYKYDKLIKKVVQLAFVYKLIV